MQSDLTESVQASIRPGEMKDTFYCGESNLCKQAYPCVINNRFVQAFTQLGAGSSQFVISPQQGVSDIVLQLAMPAVGSGGFTSATGLALSDGWGYGLINRISVRYGSSAQYFWSGAQVLLQNLIDAENTSKVNAMLKAGGNFTTPTQLQNATTNSPILAYVYLKLPHNSCRADGKPLPFNSDLLVQPIVITVEMLNPQSVFIVQQTGTPITNGPTQLGAAQLQVRQEMLTDTSDLLARRVDMNSHAYTFPLPYFCQQETQVQIPASTNLNTINLTGFRAGEVKNIVLWLTLDSEQVPSSGSWAPAKWYPLSTVTLTYNGEIFSRYDGGASQLWNLVSDAKGSYADQLVLATPGNAAGASTTVTTYWTDCPFAQVNVPKDKEMTLIHGKPILNAVVNLSFLLPTNAAYTLHAMYLYNASLLCSRGSAEYIF